MRPMKPKRKNIKKKLNINDLEEEKAENLFCNGLKKKFENVRKLFKKTFKSNRW